MTIKTHSGVYLENYLHYIGRTNYNSCPESLIRRTLKKINLFDIVYEMRDNLGRCLFDKDYQPRYLFHGTTKDRVPQILQEGLSPSENFLGSIYFATTFEYAQRWSLVKSINEKSKSTVLYVDRNNLPEFTFERRDSTTLRCRERIPPENIKKVGPILEFLLSY